MNAGLLRLCALLAMVTLLCIGIVARGPHLGPHLAADNGRADGTVPPVQP